MEKLSDKNLTNSGWHCSHCGAFNKVAAAKFCGKCGTARIIQSEETTDKISKEAIEAPSTALAEATAFIFQEDAEETTAITIQEPTSALSHIKNWFLPNAEKAFKMVIASACCLLVTSVLCGYKMYTNVDTIRIARSSFSDISTDHPVYEVCRNLLSINAIGYRKDHELAPYESISATEWNHALKQSSKYISKDIPVEAYFSSKETVSLDRLNNKLRILRLDTPELADTSRIQSFYFLERSLFN